MYCVFLQDFYVKAFKTRVEADICVFGIQAWLVDRGFDPEIVAIKEEVVN